MLIKGRAGDAQAVSRLVSQMTFLNFTKPVLGYHAFCIIIRFVCKEVLSSSMKPLPSHILFSLIKGNTSYM